MKYLLTILCAFLAGQQIVAFHHIQNPELQNRYILGDLASSVLGPISGLVNEIVRAVAERKDLNATTPFNAEQRLVRITGEHVVRISRLPKHPDLFRDLMFSYSSKPLDRMILVAGALGKSVKQDLGTRWLIDNSVLTALANHGYLPRNGFTDILQITNACQKVYRLGAVGRH